MDDRNRVSLTVGGSRYGGWTDINVTRSLEAISGKFTITLTERWEENVEPWPILAGDRCSLRIGQDLVIDGHVDVVSPSYGATSHSITVSGRDLTADLVDCSCMLDADQFTGATLAQIVRRIVEPFGMTVRDDSGKETPFERFKIQQGETAFDAIERACRQRAVLPISIPGVGLVLRRADDHTRAASSPLIQGQNILGANARLSVADRFSEYVVRGQRGTSDLSTPDDVSVMADAKDANIGRYRPMLVVVPLNATTAEVKQRAEWEATVRAARAATATINVQGWRRADGALWQPGVVVPIVSPWLRLNGDYLIKTVTLKLSENGGTTAALEITSPSAFIPEPEIPSRKKKGKGKGKGGGGVAWDLFEITEVNQ